MLDNRFFKTTNSFICIGIDKQITNQIRKNAHENLRIIHVFVNEPENADITSLSYYADMCDHAHVHMILHCPDKLVRAKMRKALKGIPKGKWFHMSLRYRMEFALSEAKKLFITEANRIVIRETKFQHSKLQVIEFAEQENLY